MKYIHWLQQGKGGCGKTYAAWVLHQYFEFKGRNVVALDTDPVNHSYAAYNAFNVQILPMMKDMEIVHRAYDEIAEIAMSMPDESCMVIDSGASAFYPALLYLKQTQAHGLLRENDITTVFHSVLNGGGALQDTVDGLQALVDNFDDIPIVVWLNHKDGKVMLDGKGFNDFLIYKNNSDRFSGIIDLPDYGHTTFGKDLVDLLTRKQTFEEAQRSNASIMVKHRLGKYWQEVRDKLDAALLELS